MFGNSKLGQFLLVQIFNSISIPKFYSCIFKFNFKSISILQNCVQFQIYFNCAYIFKFNFKSISIQQNCIQFQIYFNSTLSSNSILNLFQFCKAAFSISIFHSWSSNLFQFQINFNYACIFKFNFKSTLQSCIFKTASSNSKSISNYARLHFIRVVAFHFSFTKLHLIHIATKLHCICMVAFHFHKHLAPIIFLAWIKIYIHIFTSSLLQKYQNLRSYIF